MIKRAVVWLLPLFVFASSAEARVPDFADLVERNSSAVVKISTVSKAPEANAQVPNTEELPEMFREFFERRGAPRRNATAMGSGFIISRDGYVVTNNHVIEGADEITVRLIDRRELSAEIVGADPRSDLALLKVEADDLPVASFAKPGSLRVGEWVVAVGSPFGLDYSASAGIVSAIGRSLPTERGENYVPFIQSDVAINPGNSGGPLFNQDGQVVGINSQIFTRSGGSIGLSFAIPVSVAIDVVEQLKKSGRVERGWLGVYIQEVDRDLAKSLGLDKPTGALVSQVIPESPAEKAGFEAGDVIIRFNDKEILESGDLPHEVGLLAPDSRVKAVVVRNGKRRTLDVEVGALPDTESMASTTPANGDQESDILGLSVEEINEETAAQLRVSGGMVVEKVSPDSPAAYAQLHPGDVIVQLGDRPINGRSAYREALKQLPKGTPVLVRFIRQGQFVYRTIEINP